jgi:hypothetical protein
MTDVGHAALYLLPGAALLALTLALWNGGRFAARQPGAPRWALWWARVTLTLLALCGGALLAVGAAAGRLLLRR